MKTYELSSGKKLILNSSLITLDPSKTYQWSFDIVPIYGNEKCAFAVMIFCDEMGNELERRLRFFKNFTGTQQNYFLVSRIPQNATKVILGFRINCEGAEPNDVKIKLPSFDDTSIIPIDDVPESHDGIFDYEKAFEEIDLEKNWWQVVGGNENLTNFITNGKKKLEVLKYFGLKPKSTLLDVGCGTGILINHLRSYLSLTSNYVGTDLVEKAVKYCKKQYPDFEFYKNEMTKLPNLGRFFDMVCLFSVFTHIFPNEVKELLLEIKKYLKPNGCIVASVILNQKIMHYKGTRSKIEMNEKFFLDLVRSAGFFKIEKYPKDLNRAQVRYKISS